MHHHDVAGAVAMGMGVFLGGTPMRGPAGMADPVRTVHRIQAYAVFQVAQFAGSAAHAERAILVQHGESRRVVTSVLQAAQTVQNDGNRFALSDIADNSAHDPILVVRMPLGC